MITSGIFCNIPKAYLRFSPARDIPNEFVTLAWVPEHVSLWTIYNRGISGFIRHACLTG